MTFLETPLKTCLFLAATLTVAPALAAPESFTIDSRHTFPVFEVSHLGYSLQRGRFNKTSGKIVLDTAAKSGSVELTIDAASIDMGLEKWDEHMKGEDFFNVAKHPTMTFRSSKLLFSGDKVVGAEGDFTLLGVTQPLKVTFADFNCAMHPYAKKMACGGNATAAIKRSAFGMTYGVPGIGDDVKLSIPVEAFKD